MDIRDLYESLLEDVSEHRADILVGFGLASMAGAIAATVVNAPKMRDDIEACKKGLGVEKLPFKLLAKIAARRMWPTFALFLAGAGCVIGADRIRAHEISVSAATIVGLEAAANDIHNEYRAYREETAKVLGPEKEDEIKEAAEAEEPPTALSVKNPIIITGTGSSIFIDVCSGRKFVSDKDDIRDAFWRLKEQALEGNCEEVKMSDLYEELGLPLTSMSECDGWTAEDVKTYGFEPLFGKITDNWTGETLYLEVRPYPWPRRLREKV